MDSSIGTLVLNLRAEAAQWISGFDSAVDKAKSSHGKWEQMVQSAWKTVEVSSAASVAALTAVGVAAVKTYADFDAAMLRSMANMGEFDRSVRDHLETVVRRMAVETGRSANEFAGGLYVMKKAGVDTAEMEHGLAVAHDYAETRGLKLNQGIRQLSETMRALGVEAKNSSEMVAGMAHVSDMLTFAGAHSKAEVTELADALNGYLGTVLKDTKQSAEAGIAAVMVLTDRMGGSAHRSAMYLADALQTLQQSSTKNAYEFYRLGIQVHDASGQFLPLTQLIDQLANRFKGMSSQQRLSELATLGLSGRTALYLTTLFDASKQLRDYEVQLKTVDGSTDRAAKTLDEGLNQQMEKLMAALRELLLVMGKEMLPQVKELTQWFTNLARENSEFKVQAAVTGSFLRDSFLTSVVLVKDSMRGWQIIVVAVKLGFMELVLLLGTVHTAIVEFAVDANKQAVKVVNEWIDTAERIANAVSKTKVEFQRLKPDVGLQMMAQDLEFTKAKVTKTVEDLKKQLELLRHPPQTAAEWQAWYDQSQAEQREKVNNLLTAFFRSIDAKSKENMAAMQRAADEATAAAAAATDAATANIRRKWTEADAQVRAIIKSSTPWREGAYNVSILTEMLEDGAISVQQYTTQMARLQATMGTSATTQVSSLAASISTLNAKMRDGVITAEQYRNEMNSILNKSNPNLFGPETLSKGDMKQGPSFGMQLPWMTRDSTAGMMGTSSSLLSGPMAQGQQMIQQRKELERSYNEQLKMLQNLYNAEKKEAQKHNKETELLEKTHLATMKSLEDNYRKQKLQSDRQMHQLMLSSWESAMGAWADTLREGFGEASAVYKVAFAAQKAFAIAQAMINIKLAIAQAATAEPWWMKAAAIANVVALTAGLVSDISSVVMSFEGGGDTPSGPRSGGLDGRGGFMAMLHPDERVIDKTVTPQGGNTSAGRSTVNVHNYVGAQVTTKDNPDGSLDVIVKQIDQQMAKNIRDRRGQTAKAMEGTYNLRRGQGNRRATV